MKNQVSPNWTSIFWLFSTVCNVESTSANIPVNCWIGHYVLCSARSLGNPTTLRNRGSSEMENHKKSHLSFSRTKSWKTKCHQIGHLFFDFFQPFAMLSQHLQTSLSTVELVTMYSAQQEVSVIRRLCEIEAHPRWKITKNRIVFFPYKIMKNQVSPNWTSIFWLFSTVCNVESTSANIPVNCWIGHYVLCSARSLGNPTTLRNRGSSEMENHKKSHCLFPVQNHEKPSVTKLDIYFLTFFNCLQCWVNICKHPCQLLNWSLCTLLSKKSR